MSLAELSPTRRMPEEERRAHILAAAERAFVRYGFHAATMSQVADEANMSAGNLYRYFPSKEAIVEGHVLRDGAPVATGYARLLGTGDEFVAEVPLGEDGGFRFFAAPGDWTLRVLAPGGVRAERTVQADYGQVTKVDVTV